jgi:hypothetical protein
MQLIRRFELFMSSLLLLACLPAPAETLTADTPLPMALSARSVTIASRTLSLPEGQWQLVARQAGRISQQERLIGDWLRGYAMQIDNGVFKQGVVVTLPLTSVSISSWQDDPCKGEAGLFSDELGGNFKQPECLRVWKRASHLARSSGEFYPQAESFAAQQKIKLPGPVYEVFYARYASNEFGAVRLFIPAARFAGDDAAIAWARTVPATLKRLFEGRDANATLPALP